MKAFKRYLVPSVIAALLLAGFFVSSYIQTKNKKIAKRDDTEVKMIQLPHGRVLYVVVEEDGFYIGQEFVPFLLFSKYLERNRFELKPDYALIMGTECTKYGHVAEAYVTIKEILNIPSNIVTIPTLPGTRRGPIEVHDRFWEY